MVHAVLVAGAVGCGVSRVAAQAEPYPGMGPVGAYLMDRAEEIRLARSAAPDSISRDAAILVLGRQGYERVVEGRNGFVCFVGRSWLAGFDWPEFWNPKVRAPDCMNPQAARFLTPILSLRSRLVLAGRSREDVAAELRAAFQGGQLPALEPGALEYMMSREAWLTDQGGHNASHLMFLTSGVTPAEWGAGVAGSPVMAAPYWYFLPTPSSAQDGLPPITVFLVGVGTWSDGSPAAP